MIDTNGCFYYSWSQDPRPNGLAQGMRFWPSTGTARHEGLEAAQARRVAPTLHAVLCRRWRTPARRAAAAETVDRGEWEKGYERAHQSEGLWTKYVFFSPPLLLIYWVGGLEHARQIC
ncbi:hypothetical protein EE612_056018 [Oryza sativa]|nr:hypothetical protein EE612_056018 [Oryza sativa]